MVESLQVLLDEVIDYAGMFPPARLPLNESVRNYVRYKNGKEAWIVGKFVCPVQKIAELEAAMKWHDYDDRLGVCSIGRGGADVAEFVANSLADLKSTRRVDRAFVDTFETRLPQDAMDSAELRPIALRLSRALDEGTNLFLELPFGAGWEVSIPRSIEALATVPRVRAKVRCGGETASAFPTVEQLAVFIAECAKHDLAFKATAGLHHPIRKYDEASGATMHGFLNVFSAAAVAHAFRVQSADLVPILAATSPSDFRCLSSRLSTGNWHLSLKQLRASREFALGYGSCSVAEPLGDLAQLGHSARQAV